MNASTRNTLIGLAIVLIISGLAFFLFQKPSPDDSGSATSPDLVSALSNASSTFGSATSTPVIPTSTESVPQEKTRWDVDRIDSRSTAFTPPKGYWVYFSQLDGAYWLVNGTAPAPGSSDPLKEAKKNRVAVFYPVAWDHESFSAYDRFVTTMAQFECAQGTTTANITSCLDSRMNASSGKTASGLTYDAFTLQAVNQSSQSRIGTRSYVAVRLGGASDYVVLIAASPDAKGGAAAALSLAKSMRIDAKF